MNEILGDPITDDNLPSAGGSVDVSNINNPAGTLQPVNTEAWKSIYVAYQSQNVNVFLDDCYTGDGGFRGNVDDDGAYSYVLPKATENFYKTRVKNAEYKNLFAPYIHAKSDPIFAGGVLDIVLSGKDYLDDDVYLDFSYDATGTGKSLNEIRQELAILSDIHNVAFEVMDRVDDGLGGKKTISYTKSAKDVDAYTFDPRNKKLTTITFWETNEITPEGKMYFIKYLWEAGTLKVLRSKPTQYGTLRGDAEFDGTVHEEFSTGIDMLNVNPVFSTTGEMGDYKPNMPKSYSVARLCAEFYNLASLLNYLILKQGHGLLVFQGEMRGLRDMLSNVVEIPANETGGRSYQMPEILTIDPDIVRVQIENLIELHKWIVTSMGNNGVTVTQGAESGVSKAYDYVGTANEAQRAVKTQKRADKWRYNMFNLFEGRVNPPEYITEYPKDFFPKADIDVTEYMDHVATLAEMGLKENTSAVLKVAIQKILTDKPSSELGELMEEIDAYTEKLLANMDDSENGVIVDAEPK